ncbi:MAG: ZIP family metal transporter [Clostridia bacterium]|nr:ZIP family metal transporter [Clostridia bacterium]
MSNTWITVLGISFIFVMTTLGAAVVYFFKNDIPRKVNTMFLGFASGIMIAASIWSLLLPALDASANYGKLNWLPVVIGFGIGGLFLTFLDKVVPHRHKSANVDEGPKSALNNHTKLFLAVMIHNIPEGLAVGFAFGAAALVGQNAAFISALGLALGIGIQNFPEGAAVALPMRNYTKSRNKSFLFGMASGAVEPVAAVIGYFFAAYIAVLQPWLLAFAAGAMIFVVAEDLIPDSKLDEFPRLGAWGVMFGFAVMMILEIAFG